MSIRNSYNSWSDSYDSMKNRTRDLEKEILKKTFLNLHYGHILELGCGTGKNSAWLSEKADYVKAFDFSPEMIKKAKKKAISENVEFVEVDITEPWPVSEGWANLITCSLVLEHIQDLQFIFEEASRALKLNGMFYIAELHPWKMYNGSQARFETESGIHRPLSFLHHISDYLKAAKKENFALIGLDEHFDDREKDNFPRLVSMVFESQK